MEAHASKVRRTYIAGAGVSGGLLATAAIVFISLIGLVSFEAWPQSDEAVEPVNSMLAPAQPVESPASQNQIPAPAVPAPAASPRPAIAGPSGADQGDGKSGATRKSKGKGDGGVRTVPPTAAAPVTSTPETSSPGGSSIERSRSGTGSTSGSSDQSTGGSTKHPSGRSSTKLKGKGKSSRSARGTRGNSNGSGLANGHSKHGR